METDGNRDNEETPSSGQRPGRGSRRAHFERSTTPSVSPSPSRRRDAGDGINLQDQLLEALLSNDLAKFQELVRNRKVDKNYKYGRPYFRTCLEIACGHEDRGDFVRVLLEHVKPNVNKVIPEPIHYAAQKGNHDSLAVLLSDKRTKVYAINSKGQTALHLTCGNMSADRVNDYERCIKLLMPKMSIADLNKPDSNGFTAFHTLVRGPGKRGSVLSRKHKSVDIKINEDECSENGCSAGFAERLGWEDGTDGGGSAGGNGDSSSGGGGGESMTDSQAREHLATLMLRLAHGALDLDSVRTKGRTAREDAERNLPGLRPLLPPARREITRADPLMALANALREGNFRLFSALLQQTDEDGNPALDPNHCFGYPLHCTCLELACARCDGAPFVEALLRAGADPNVPNRLSEKYPVHVACEKGHHDELRALFDFSFTDPNCSDRFGNTPLHCCVDRISDDKRREAGRLKCLGFLLTLQQLDVKRTNNAGYTALMLAVDDGNKSVIKTFLGKSRYFENLDLKGFNIDNTNGKPLRDAIVEKFPQLQDLLVRPGSAEALTLRRQKTKELFELLNTTREDDFVIRIESDRPRNLALDDKKFTLLQRAARYGLLKAVRALLDAGADPNKTFSCNPSPPGVLASYHRHYNVLKTLLLHKEFDVNLVDAKGNTALHYAARAENNLNMVILLLRHGADMYVRNNLGKSPFGPDQVQSLLDQCVGTNGKNALEEDYELVLDYRLLAHGPLPQCEINVISNYTTVPTEDAEKGENGAVKIVTGPEAPVSFKLKSEMGFLNMMRKNEDLSGLLDHPVALSFLNLKWNRMKYMAFFNLGVYIFFLIFLNIYIVSETHKTRSQEKSLINNLTIPFGSATLFFWSILTARELLQLLLDTRKYVKSWENYLDWSVLLFSLSSLILPHVGAPRDLTRIVNVLTIMVSCAELLFLLRRISRFAKYIEMLKVVILSYILPLVSYIIIIISFALSFHTLCYESRSHKLSSNDTEALKGNDSNFETWHMSIVKSLVMMTGEFEFQSWPDNSSVSIILFVVFLFLVTVVLLNLLTGLAVSDTARIENAAQKLRLQSRVEVVLRSERILVNLHNSECVALRCLRVPGWMRDWLCRAVLFPGGSLDGREGRVKPNHKAEVVLGEGYGGEVRERRRLDRESLDQATQILSRRGAEAAQQLTLADVDARIQEVLKTIKALETRCAPVVARGDARLFSQMSVFSDVSPEEWQGEAGADDVMLVDSPAGGGHGDDGSP